MRSSRRLVQGMGEVYRARFEARAARSPSRSCHLGLQENPERLDRFQREAKVLASLNHPDIASIYGFEDSDKPGLVMELIEGATGDPDPKRKCPGSSYPEDTYGSHPARCPPRDQVR